MKLGDRIKIKDAEGGKWWGRVVEVESHTEMVDITAGGLFPGGPPPDPYRKFMPGRTTTVVTIQMEGPR